MNWWTSSLVVGAGGFFGSVLRHALGVWLNRPGAGVPLGTLSVNLFGALALGVVVGAGTSAAGLAPNTRLFLATGVCGGFTTMSTFTGELFHLLRDGRTGAAALYLVATVGIGLALFAAGLGLARWALRGAG
jgi:CrcB protein